MSHRKQRLESFLLREVGEFIDRNFDRESGIFISVSAVAVSESTDRADIFVSIFPDKHTEKTFAKLKRFEPLIKKHIGKRLKRGNIPKIVLVPDTGREERIRLEKILQKIEHE